MRLTSEVPNNWTWPCNHNFDAKLVPRFRNCSIGVHGDIKNVPVLSCSGCVVVPTPCQSRISATADMFLAVAKTATYEDIKRKGGISFKELSKRWVIDKLAKGASS